MNEVWKKIFEKYVESYRSVKTLEKNGIIGEEVAHGLYMTLLEDLMVTMESEIDE